MTFISSHLSGRLSSIILKIIVVVLVNLSLFVFQANAKTSGHNSASDTSNLIQTAQTRLCNLPRVMINGVCRRPIRLKCRVGGRPCAKGNAAQNPANLRRPDKLRRPIRRCLPPSKIINGRCTPPALVLKSARCSPPSKIINRNCVLPNPIKRKLKCGPHKKRVNGQCIAAGQIPECPRFFVRVRGRCERIALKKTCPPSEALIGNRCVPLAVAVKCLPPLVRIDGKCISINIIAPPCKAPKKIIAGKCRLPGAGLFPAKCKSPLKRIDGVCRFPNLGNLCIPPKKMIGGVCKSPNQIVCARPRVSRGARCVLPNPSCQIPFVRSPITNRCYLPFEVEIIPEAECRPPWFYSERSGGCAKLRPRPRSRENIVWIQSCLNTLGYRAGVEDGISGRQTRSAWEDFRRAFSLRGIVGFDDPETLGALFRECSPEPREVAQPRPTETAVEPPIETEEPASDLKYRQSMCATGKLYSLLNETYGDTIKLEQCGGACLPIPEGMAEANVRRLETDQGIRWCKDCVKIGDEGILCPVPALQ
ncbi:MAG: hypothetical protein COB78_01805 [Hyphomicrobiales bacterium]|nr:MAG: hypothetical protein COB78_01805 [Hyphomicrobiales bacterium]